MEKIYCLQCREPISNNNSTYYRGLVLHNSCLSDYQNHQDNLYNAYNKNKMETYWNKALKNISKSYSLNSYFEEAQVVLDKAMSDYKKFQSSHEMMVAMELLRNRIHTKSQFRILNYKVDFLLPELKIALEIDGGLHKFQIVNDSTREIKIMNELNKDSEGWEVIRIPTNLLEKDIQRLVPAIKILYKERQKLRKQNDGFLPTNWSKTNRHAQLDILSNLDKSTDSYKNVLADELNEQL